MAVECCLSSPHLPCEICYTTNQSITLFYWGNHCSDSLPGKRLFVFLPAYPENITITLLPDKLCDTCGEELLRDWELSRPEPLPKLRWVSDNRLGNFYRPGTKVGARYKLSLHKEARFYLNGDVIENAEFELTAPPCVLYADTELKAELHLGLARVKGESRICLGLLFSAPLKDADVQELFRRMSIRCGGVQAVNTDSGDTKELRLGKETVRFTCHRAAHVPTGYFIH